MVGQLGFMFGADTLERAVGEKLEKLDALLADKEGR